MKLKMTLSVLTFVFAMTLSSSQIYAQTNSKSAQIENQDINGRHAIGSSVFILGNLAPGDPPHYVQLNYGYQLSQKDIIIVEAITWTYYDPLGTYESSDEHYPGKIRAYGIGAGYQRFIWKNLYSTVQATPFIQQFFDEENNKIQNGFQLYLQFRLGYRFELFKQRWFLEPSVVFNYWPINTNFPDSFKEIEKGAPNYSFEPGLNFGFRY